MRYVVYPVLQLLDFALYRMKYLVEAVEQGFEPRSATLKAAVLPLNYSTMNPNHRYLSVTKLNEYSPSVP